MEKSKIVILGSCVTRDNFNSLFNQNWKEHFEILFHQHQTSLVSLMKPSVEFPQILEDETMRDFDKICLKQDFSKSFLNEISNLNPKYLLIDFFADVYYGVLQIGDNKYITNNGGKIWNTEFYKNLEYKKTLSFIENENEYFDLWVKSFSHFLKIIEQTLPNTEILITKFYFSDYYRCIKTGEIKNISQSGKKFNGNKKIYNEILNQLYSYIELNTNIRFIDLTKKEYLLREDHPWGLYYVHYEQEYYTDFINKLNSIISNDNNSNLIINRDSKEFTSEILHIDFNEVNGQLDLEIIIENFNEADEYKLCFIERRIGLGNKLFNPKKVFFDLNFNNKILKSSLCLKENLNILAYSEIWDIYLYNIQTKDYSLCKMNNINFINFKYFNDQKLNKSIKPYKSGLGSLSIYCKFLYEFVNVRDFSDNNQLRFKFDSEIIDDTCFIRFKRRIHRFIDSFDSYIDYQISNYEVIIDLKSFIGINIIQGDVYEAYLVIGKGTDYEYEIPITSQNIKTNFKIINDIFKVKSFLSSKKRLSLFFVYNNLLKIQSLDISKENVLNINLSNKDNYNIIKMELLPFNNLTYLREGYSIDSFNFNLKSNMLSVKLEELYKLITLFKTDNFLLNLVIEYKESSRLIRENIYLQLGDSLDNNQFLSSDYILSINQGKSLECIFNLSKINKIAILGSCFTRAAFSSSSFYNPDYKSKYNIVLTQFHSSLISLTCNNKKIFEENYFKKLNPTNKGYLKVDFEKTFFNLLEESNPDYLIIDIYADAQKGIICFSDGSIITGNVDVENSDLMYHLPKDVEIILPNETDKYLDIWKDSARKFVEIVKKYIAEEKIIINYFYATEKYLDKDSKIVTFDKQLSFIQKSNLLADWMNNYLKYLLPKSKVIDSRKLNYIGYEKHPLGNTPNHYESGYYKDFMKLVDEIILNK